MIFDSDNKVLIETLDEGEIKDFKRFLEDEIAIHKDKIQDCYDRLCNETDAYKEFLKSSIKRHQLDVFEAIEILRSLNGVEG